MCFFFKNQEKKLQEKQRAERQTGILIAVVPFSPRSRLVGLQSATEKYPYIY